MRRVQVVPKGKYRLYSAMVSKEIELSRKNKGTFHRSGPKQKNRTKWAHSTYPGWVNLAKGMGEIVEIQVQSKRQGGEWQLLQAILGFIDRHFGEEIHSINIQYEE